MRGALSEWLYDRECRRARTTAKDVARYLRDEGHLVFNPNSSKEATVAYRCVARYVQRIGLVQSARKGTTYKLKPEIVLRRDQYVRQMTELRGERRIVYLDESYTHHNYNKLGDSLRDPGETRPVPKGRHKGQRYCFIAAIVSADPRDPTSEAFLLDGGTLDIFEGGKRAKKKETKD